MLESIRNCITRAVMPLAWGMNLHRAAEALKKFSNTESDSGWQYLRAFAHTGDVQLKRMLFSNVIEEYRHADYFGAAAHRLARSRLQGPVAERTRLVRSNTDLPYFLAYAHESEHCIHSQFDTYARSCGISEVSEVFQRICQDEERHEKDAEDFLSQQVGKKKARRLVIKARMSRLTESWTRGSQAIGAVMFGLVLGSIFFLYGTAMALFTLRPSIAQGRQSTSD